MKENQMKRKEKTWKIYIFWIRFVIVVPFNILRFGGAVRNVSALLGFRFVASRRVMTVAYVVGYVVAGDSSHAPSLSLSLFRSPGSLARANESRESREEKVLKFVFFYVCLFLFPQFALFNSRVQFCMLYMFELNTTVS